MIGLYDFLSAIEANAARTSQYQNACDGTGGKCDCIGLVIGALRMAGEEWPWTHGSNYAARNRVRNFRSVSSAGDVHLGEAVFKAREPGESGWKLPDSYRSSADQRDYYHVGVVTSISPLEITHCTSVDGGIQRDTKLGKWRFAGEINLVDYTGEAPEETALYTAIVHADNGYPVKLRSQPTTNAGIIKSVALNTAVAVLREENAVWAKVQADGLKGYMMRKFLSKEQAETGEQHGFLTVPREKLDSIYNMAAAMMREIESIRGGG